MFSIAHRDVDGKIALYARVKRLDDLLFWNANGSSWTTTESGLCNVVLTEDLAMPGRYTASATFNPSHGTTYEVGVYESGGTLIVKTKQPFVSDKKTALQMVNDIQAALRMPQSADFTAPHAKLVLSQVNTAIQFMIETCEWPEMNLDGSFMTKAGVSVYSLRPVNASLVDTIKRLQIGTSVPLTKQLDGPFRSLQKVNTTQTQPTDYRIYARAGGNLIIELTPTPGAAYQVDFDIMLQAAMLSAITDIPLLESQTVFLGGLAFSKKEQGQYYQDDLGAFQSKVNMQAENQSEPNWGDAEAV